MPTAKENSWTVDMAERWGDKKDDRREPNGGERGREGWRERVGGREGWREKGMKGER